MRHALEILAHAGGIVSTIRRVTFSSTMPKKRWKDPLGVCTQLKGAHLPCSDVMGSPCVVQVIHDNKLCQGTPSRINSINHQALHLSAEMEAEVLSTVP